MKSLQRFLCGGPIRPDKSNIVQSECSTQVQSAWFSCSWKRFIDLQCAGYYFTHVIICLGQPRTGISAHIATWPYCFMPQPRHYTWIMDGSLSSPTCRNDEQSIQSSTVAVESSVETVSMSFLPMLSTVCTTRISVKFFRPQTSLINLE